MSIGHSMARDRGNQPERVVKGDPTVLKVYMSLDKVGIRGMQAIEAVTQMQLDGIVFRERDVHPHENDMFLKNQIDLGMVPLECTCGGCILDRRELGTLPDIPEGLCGVQGCVYPKGHERTHTWER